MTISESEFNQVIYNNQHLIWKVCHMYGQTEEDREDLFQEIVLKLWQGIASFRDRSKLSTWLYRVALNTAISQYRKSKKYMRRQPEEPSYYLSRSSGPEEDQIKALYAGIRRLGKVERAVILLYLEELSYEEIAEITGLSKSNVSVKLVRIKAKLEKEVKDIIEKIN